MRYLKNIWLWVIGWTKFGKIDFRSGWSAGHPKWWFVYLLDYGVNVLTGGAVEPISTRAQKHRSGVFWDKLLDVIEKYDRGHGERSGPALWGSKECSKVVQILSSLVVIPAIFLGLLLLTKQAIRVMLG